MGSKINFFPHLPLANELRKFTGHRFFLSFFFLLYYIIVFYIIFIFFYNVLFKTFEPVRFVFERTVLCSAKLHLFDQKYSHTVKY